MHAFEKKETKTHERKTSRPFGTKELRGPFPLEYCSNNKISQEKKHMLPSLVFVSCAEVLGSHAIRLIRVE
jgi:hypothetical protein